MTTHFGEWLGKSNADTMLSELLYEALTRKQFRAVWTTYCIMMELIPGTAGYDNKLLETYNNYWCFEVGDYDEYELYMSKLL